MELEGDDSKRKLGLLRFDGYHSLCWTVVAIIIPHFSHAALCSMAQGTRPSFISLFLSRTHFGAVPR